ncbi:MAG: hypothetical protein SP1CHLAM54_04210 [Chlamydiia bacterium]|nr:hypothetical protein [Chlamydiia bacterium]MCH9615336.1 hypothetical protein [Chlamydiia bacterium]MCH9628342.1 hypothetical protein [Chlamydiia bacterium]
MHETIRDIVTLIDPFDPLERTHKADVLEWIRKGHELFRQDGPATPPKHLVSYFVPIDCEAQSLLLVDHKKAGLWLPPGGHVDPDEHPQEAAKREMKEELKVNLPLLKKEPLLVTVTQTKGNVIPHTDVSLWYVFKAKAGTEFDYDPREFKTVAWFKLDELPMERTDPHMKRFAQKLKQQRF